MNYNFVRVKDLNTIQSEKITAVDEFIYEWGDFIGDKRALNKEGRKLVSKKEVPPPTREYQLKITLKKIINKLFRETKAIMKEEVKF